LEREGAAVTAVWVATKAITKIGMGMKTKKKKQTKKEYNAVSFLFYRCWEFSVRWFAAQELQKL